MSAGLVPLGPDWGQEPCIPWWGYIHHDGYGIQKVKGRTVTAHRFIYEQCFGTVPEHLHLDHLCRNRACVNPAHLEPVTPRVKALRGEGPTAINARKTHCSNGHPYEGDNLYVSPKGWRYCQNCMAANRRKYEERKRVSA